MKNNHRKMHRFAWLLLLPVLLFVIFHAQQGRFNIEDRYKASSVVEQGEKL